MTIKPLTEELRDLNKMIAQFSVSTYTFPTPYYRDVNGYLYPNIPSVAKGGYVKTYLGEPVFGNAESFAVRGGKGNKITYEYRPYNPTKPDDLDRIMLSLKEKQKKFSCLCCGRPISAGERYCKSCGCYFPEFYEKFEISQNF